MSENLALPRAALNRAAILARVEGDQELLAELVGLFLESCPELLAQLRHGVARGDAGQVRASVHAFKGAVANFTDGPAYQTARGLEEMGRAGDVGRAGETAALLEQEVWALGQALAEWCGKPTVSLAQ